VVLVLESLQRCSNERDYITDLTSSDVIGLVSLDDCLPRDRLNYILNRNVTFGIKSIVTETIPRRWSLECAYKWWIYALDKK
jgi:hypothetical protein